MRRPLVLAVLVAMALVGRIIWVGVYDADAYIAESKRRTTRTITLSELRGSILDRNGETLVMSVPSKRVVADPTLVEDADVAATTLSGILGVPREQLINALERPDANYSIVQRQVAPELAEKVEAAAIPGVFLEPDQQRVPLNGWLARSVLGSMPKFAEDAEGLSGIERLLNESLSPVDGKISIQRGVGGSTIPGSEKVETEATPGAEVTLTIDHAMQLFVEKVLRAQIEATGARGGCVVIGVPGTGEILASASATRRQGEPGGEVIQGSLNQTVRLYEPGSVMKIVVVALALELGIVTPDTTFVVPPKITLYDRTVKDAHKHPTQKMTVAQILAESSNVGMIKIAQRIEKERGIKTIIQMLRSFGFGEVSALGLPLEQAGIVKPRWNGTDIASIPIGHSITVSPVQVWAAYNTIANAGLYVPPRIVRDVVDAQGRHPIPPAPKPHPVVSPATANTVTSLLEGVVERGTAKDFRIPGVKVAAKTGTAYKVLADGTYGNDATRKYATSFVGFFPASAPEISIMVVIDEPKSGFESGAEAAGPVFDKIAREAMRRYAIAGDSDSARNPSKPVKAKAATAPTTVAPTTVAPTTVAPTTMAPASASPGSSSATSASPAAPTPAVAPASVGAPVPAAASVVTPAPGRG